MEHIERGLVMALYADRAATIDTENAFKVGPYIKKVEDSGHKVVKCNLGEPDFPLAEHIRDEVKKQLDNDLTHYNDPQGILPLRESIAKHISKTRGIDVTPEQVVVFPGAKPPIGLCQQTYCNPGDEVIYPSPGFPIYESFISYVGAKPVPLHLREEKDFSFNGEDLEKLITPRTKLIYINFPSNPTGGVATEKQLNEIADIIKNKAPNDIRVYSDEVYEHILFDGSKHKSISALLPDKTVIVSGVSKSYSWTGGRIGWAVYPSAEEAAVFKNLNINYFSCVPAYNQMGAKMAIDSPKSEPTIERMVSAFQERRNFVVKRLNEITGITCKNPSGAFYVFPNISGFCKNVGALKAFENLPQDIKLKTSPSTMIQMFLLFRHNIATMDRRSFGRIGTDGMHFLRLSIATSLDELKDGMNYIAEAATDSEGFASFVKEGPLY